MTGSAEEWMHRVLDGLAEIVFPRRCSGCGLRGVWVCDACLKAMPLFEDPVCDRCGIPLHHFCRCAHVPEAIDKLRSAGPYDGWLREGVHRMKYQGESARAAHLASLLESAVRQFTAAEAIVAVPLHSSRQEERGYNQSELIATHLASATGLPLWPALIRKRDTRHQVDLSRDERAANMHDAFALRGGTSMRPSRVMLIDDVFTTGATTGECARTLRLGGVSTIYALTIC